jgi:hypothetical protein
MASQSHELFLSPVLYTKNQFCNFTHFFSKHEGSIVFWNIGIPVPEYVVS